MDVSFKLKTYRGFILGVQLFTVHLIVIISFLLVTFCGGGFGAGILVAIVEIAIGVYVARNRARYKAAHPATQPEGSVEAQIVTEAANRNAADQHAA